MAALRGAALIAARLGATGAELARELRRRRDGARLRVRAADVHAGVVVRPADAGATVRLDVDRGGHVELARTRAVARLPDREQLGEAAAVTRRERRSDRIERVRQRAGDPVPVQVVGAFVDVARVLLQPFVLGRRDPIAENVDRLRLTPEAR